MARPEGFEPPTNRIGTCYSIQLSYGRLAVCQVLPDRALMIRTQMPLAKAFTLRTSTGAFPYAIFAGIIPA